MRKKFVKYQFLSWGLLFVMLPSLIGVNIFKHHCFSCNEFETIATIMTIDHGHNHVHAEGVDACCSHDQNSCQNNGNTDEELCSNESCDGEYERVDFNVTVFKFIQKLKVAEIDLLHKFDFQIRELLLAYSKQNYLFQNVDLQLSEEPCLARYGVFLL